MKKIKYISKYKNKENVEYNLSVESEVFSQRKLKFILNEEYQKYINNNLDDKVLDKRNILNCLLNIIIYIRNSKKYEDDQVPAGMTPIVCQRCGRKLGLAYSTNSVATCDKCGCKFYVRIYGGVKVTMPASNLQYEGYYEETDTFIHKIRTVVNSDQKLGLIKLGDILGGDLQHILHEHEITFLYREFASVNKPGIYSLLFKIPL